MTVNEIYTQLISEGTQDHVGEFTELEVGMYNDDINVVRDVINRWLQLPIERRVLVGTIITARHEKERTAALRLLFNVAIGLLSLEDIEDSDV